MSTPIATIAGRQIPINLSAIDRLEQEFGVSFLSLAEQVQGHFEKYEEGEGEDKKTKIRMTGKSVRIGYAARFLGALLDVKPDEVSELVPRGKIINQYAEALDPFFEAVQQITGSDDTESPTQAGTSTGSGVSEQSPASA